MDRLNKVAERNAVAERGIGTLKRGHKAAKPPVGNRATRRVLSARRRIAPGGRRGRHVRAGLSVSHCTDALVTTTGRRGCWPRCWRWGSTAAWWHAKWPPRWRGSPPALGQGTSPWPWACPCCSTPWRPPSTRAGLLGPGLRVGAVVPVLVFILGRWLPSSGREG